MPPMGPLWLLEAELGQAVHSVPQTVRLEWLASCAGPGEGFCPKPSSENNRA
jgi:hypothetical protein